MLKIMGNGQREIQRALLYPLVLITSTILGPPRPESKAQYQASKLIWQIGELFKITSRRRSRCRLLLPWKFCGALSELNLAHCYPVAGRGGVAGVVESKMDLN
jgi:hypothetical protein